jgi:hypothetical protein
MESIKELAEDIFRTRVLRARQESPGQKLFDALELFDFACGWTEAGIRAQFPDANDEEVKRILRERLDWQRKREAPKWKHGDMLLP